MSLDPLWRLARASEARERREGLLPKRKYHHLPKYLLKYFSEYRAGSDRKMNENSLEERALEALRRIDHTLALHGHVDAETDLHKFIQDILYPGAPNEDPSDNDPR
jgi:hypothetical protein